MTDFADIIGTGLSAVDIGAAAAAHTHAALSAGSAIVTWDGTALTVPGKITPRTGGTALTLQNSWTNFGGAFNNAGFLQDAAGVVHLTGVVKAGTLADGTVIATLPAAQRPSQQCLFAAWAQGVAVHADNNSVARIDAHTDGTIVVAGMSTWGAGSLLSLDGISFYVGS